MAFPQNAYPNGDNFQAVSFPQEVIPPDVDTDIDVKCVRYNPAWSKVLAAACDQLTQLSAWSGTPEEKKLAVSRATNLKIQLQEFEDCDMSGCCYDTVAHRVTSDGSLEISIDGGEWIPDPNDPRIEGTQYPPIVMDETHTKCDAAINASVHIQNIISETSSQLGGAGSIIEIAAAIALAIFALFIAPESIPALAPVILPLIAGLLFVGQAAWDAYFDDTVDEIILCALFCNISDDGTFTQEQYDAFIAKLASDMPASPAKDMFISLVSRIGLVGLNDYAAIGTSADGDCTDCDCETGCGTETWVAPDGGYEDLRFGVASGLHYIEADAHDFGGGFFAAACKSTGINDCCVIDHVDIVSGSATNRLGTLCGTSGTLTPAVPDGTCVNLMYQEGTVAFTVRWYFENVEDCS